MRKFLVTCVVSKDTNIIKAGQKFEAIEDNSWLPNMSYIVITGVINGTYISGRLYHNSNILHIPVCNATFTVKEIT